MNIPYVFKKCSKCGEWLVVNTVNFRKNGKWLRNTCRQCEKEYNKKWKKYNKEHCKQYDKQYYNQNRERKIEYKKQWRNQNKEYIKEYSRQYRKENRELCKEYSRQYRKENRELCKERCKRWYKNNKEYCKEYGKRYRETPQGRKNAFNYYNKRRLEKQNQGNGITTEQWIECMKYFNWECAYSGKLLEKDNRSLDHIIPLIKSGEHEIWNLVPMLRRLNSSKNDKDMLQWYKEQPFFSEERLQKIYEWQEYAYNKWHKEEIV